MTRSLHTSRRQILAKLERRIPFVGPTLPKPSAPTFCERAARAIFLIAFAASLLLIDWFLIRSILMKTEFFYAVALPSVTKPGAERLAIGKQPGPALFYWHKDAVAFKRGLIGHGFKPRVVRVNVEYTWS